MAVSDSRADARHPSHQPWQLMYPPAVPNDRGFWSYVHADNDAEGDRICALARDIVAQYEMITAETIDLFLDVDSIEWGKNLRREIDSNLNGAAFFIPVLTPRYFLRPECRRELTTFALKAKELKIEGLVLPLHYVNVPELQESDSEDELITLLREIKWEDWRDLRFADRPSERYRRAVAALAERIVSANREAEIVAAEEESPNGQSEDEPPGPVDIMADMELAMPAFTLTITEIGQESMVIANLTTEAAARIADGDQRSAPFARRLAVARDLAQKLSEPVETISTLSTRFLSQMHLIDDGVRFIIERAPAEIASTPTNRVIFCTFFQAIKGMAVSTETSMNSTEQWIESISGTESISRDLRPPFRKLRQSLTALLEAKAVTADWVRLIDTSGVECEDFK